MDDAPRINKSVVDELAYGGAIGGSITKIVVGIQGHQPGGAQPAAHCVCDGVVSPQSDEHASGPGLYVRLRALDSAGTVGVLDIAKVDGKQGAQVGVSRLSPD